MRPLRCSVGVSMREIVDEALKSYELTDRMDPIQVAQSREKVMRYIGSLI